MENRISNTGGLFSDPLLDRALTCPKRVWYPDAVNRKPSNDTVSSSAAPTQQRRGHRYWRWAASCLVSGVLVFLTVSPASAVVVLRKGGAAEVMGTLVNQDERRVVVRELLPDGKYRDTAIPRSEIEEVLITVSAERLSALRRDKPREYVLYAEELAEKRRDPEARETALRLYQIAAWLDSPGLGKSSLLGMIDLARSASEETKFRAVAYLLDPEHDRRVLKAPQPVKLASGGTAVSRDQLLGALRLLRQGKVTPARTIMQTPAVRAQLDQYKELLPYAEVTNLRAGEALPPTLLRKVLLLETALAYRSTEDLDPKKATGASWQQSLARDGIAPLPVLSLETLTEFNPRQSQFKEGKWVEPE